MHLSETWLRGRPQLGPLSPFRLGPLRSLVSLTVFMNNKEGYLRIWTEGKAEPTELAAIGTELGDETSEQWGGTQPEKDSSRQIGLRNGLGGALGQKGDVRLLAKNARGYHVSADSAFLANRLLTVIRNGQRLILICGVQQKGRADIVAASVAVSLALTGIGATALGDCDFRYPSLHDLFGLDQSPGMLSVISGKMGVDAAICNTGVAGLSILPTERSNILPDVGFLNETRLARILTLLENRSGVILCAPPLLTSPETLVLAGQADATLLVIPAGVGRTSDLAEAEMRLASVDKKALGVVLVKDRDGNMRESV